MKIKKARASAVRGQQIDRPVFFYFFIEISINCHYIVLAFFSKVVSFSLL